MNRLERTIVVAFALAIGSLAVVGGTLLWRVVRRVRGMEAELRASNEALRLSGRELERINRLRAMASGSNRLIARVADRQALFEGVCRVAVEQGGFDSARFELAPLAAGGEALAVVGGPGEQQARFPVRVRGETIGWLWLTGSEAAYFGDEELAAVGEMMDDVAFGIEVLDRKQQLEAIAQVVETSPVVLFHWRPAPVDQVEFVSSNVARWGYAAASFVTGGRRFRDVVHPEDRDALRSEVRRFALEGRDRIALTHRLLTADGEERWIESSLLAERGQGGQVVRYRGIAIDVTDLRRVEARAQDSEARTRVSERRLREAQRIAGLGDWELDHVAGVFTLSAEAGRMLGRPEGVRRCTPEELLELVHAEDRAALQSAFQRGVDSQCRVEHELRLAPRDGTCRWVQLVAEPRRDAAGGVRGFTGTILDITARRRAEEQVREQLRELQRWHRVTLNREERVQALKQEVNELLARLGEDHRYAGPEALAALRGRVVERLAAGAAGAAP